MKAVDDEISIEEIINSIRDITQYLLEKWKVVVFYSVVGIVVGLGISFLIKPRYTGCLKFAIEEENKGGGLASLASSFGFGGVTGGQSLFSSSSIIELLQTRAMVEKALLCPMREKQYSNRTYVDFYIKENKLDKGWKDDSVLRNIRFEVGESRQSFAREKDSILGRVYARILEEELLVSQPNKENSIVQVEVTSANEIFSMNFPVELVEVASVYYTELKTAKGKSSVDVLQHQVDSVRSSLYTSMGGSASFLDKVFGLNPSMNVQRVPVAKEQTQVQINLAILQELVKNLEVAKLNLLNNTPIINIIDRPIYPLGEKKIGKTKGMVVGGIVSMLLIISYLLITKWLKSFVSREI